MWRTVRAERKGVQIKFILLNPRSHSAVPKAQVNFLSTQVLEIPVFISYAIARPSVRRLSVTFVHPTQAVEIFGNVSTPFNTLDIC